jgi:ZIP family zinc transporter
MLYVSFVDLFPSADESLVLTIGSKGSWVAVLSFFAGVILMAAIDLLVPENKLNNELVDGMNLFTEKVTSKNTKSSLYRTGIITAVAIAIHNFPEGIVTFFSALHDPVLAVSITIAIALHNIPEGISIYVPIYYATGDKKKAFGFSLLSGLAEPLGAIVGFLILKPFLTDTLFGVLFAVVAGIMVYISLDELIPSARIYGEAYLSVLGLIAGMLVISLSLLLL